MSPSLLDYFPAFNTLCIVAAWISSLLIVRSAVRHAVERLINYLEVERRLSAMEKKIGE